MLKTGLRYEDGVRLYGKYVAGWGDKFTTWRFVAKNGEETVAEVRREPVEFVRLDVQCDTEDLTEDETWDMATVRIRAVDQNGNVLPYWSQPVLLEGWAEVSPYSKTRIQAGIQSECFGWTLSDGEAFHTPEAVLSFSGLGKNGLSQNMHQFVRRHIVPEYWADRERPILLNNWEATYFKFTEHKLLSLAKKAAKLGIELFVLDDGWFGNRDSDTCALGDYSINTKKLPHGLDGLGSKLHDLGLKFGLWFEPEMVSPDSDLYRTHPKWAVQVPGVIPSLGRNQLVLDLCREEVRQYIIDQVNRILSSAPISYVKWDMNRQLTDCFSPALSEQSRFSYEWVRGLYQVFDSVTRANPAVLFEGCSSGGKPVRHAH